MAEKRMFTKKITESDAFLDMPLSTQDLYFHLNMSADDDGFVNNPRKIQRMIGAADDDMKVLLAKNFIIAFESGVIVIKHWRMHNYIQSDRYKPTDYSEEMSMLSVKENKAYSLYASKMDTECIQIGYTDKNSIDKDRLGKDSNKRVAFAPPSVEEVSAYVYEKGYHFDPESFVAFYASKGWMVGNNKMKDWKQACVTWEKLRSKDSANRPSEERQKQYDSFMEEQMNRLLNGDL